MSALKDFIKEYGDKYSKTTIYISFVFVSLLVSAILFGLFHSTGIVKLAFAGAVKEAEFGGAFAGFIVTLIFLIKSFDKKENIVLKGNVFNNNKLPIENAEIIIQGINHNLLKTDSNGFFSIELPKRNIWCVIAKYNNQSAEKKVTNKDIANSFSIYLNTTVTKPNSKLHELIEVFKVRAQAIIEKLALYETTKIKNYCNSFAQLHEKHIKSLDDNNFLLAHELLIQINNLSKNIEEELFSINQKQKVESNPLIYLETNNIPKINVITFYSTGENYNENLLTLSLKSTKKIAIEEIKNFYFNYPYAK